MFSNTVPCWFNWVAQSLAYLQFCYEETISESASYVKSFSVWSPRYYRPGRRAFITSRNREMIRFAGRSPSLPPRGACRRSRSSHVFSRWFWGYISTWERRHLSGSGPPQPPPWLSLFPNDQVPDPRRRQLPAALIAVPHGPISSLIFHS